MHITLIIILTFIASCLRIGAAPWKFFQINARYYSESEGIFSKLSIDGLIPDKWRLFQAPDEPSLAPANYPVFLKPEWGQNANGILRADNFEELQKLRSELRKNGGEEKYILQEGAPGAREFEIFSIDVDKADGQHDVVTVTEAVNHNEAYPINSKNNSHTQYCDISEQFSAENLVTLSGFLDELGEFAISRMSVRANSLEALLAGDFRVIEVNLFLPMPINLLDNSYTWGQRLSFIRRSMKSLAQATKAIKPVKNPQPIFTSMMLYGRRKSTPVTSLNKFASSVNKLAERRTFL